MSEASPLRVLLVEDQSLLRMGFRLVLEGTDIEVVGEASDGAQGVAMAQELRPDVVLMDVRMPVMDGIEATRQITQTTESRVIILTTFDVDEYAFAGLRAGASAFMLKDAQPEELVRAVQVVNAGESIVAPRMTARLVEEFINNTSTSNYALNGIYKSR